MPITALPTPPSRGANPEAFSAQADALLGALPTFVTETNATAVAVDALKSDVITLKSETEGVRDSAIAARDAAEGYRDTALTYRDGALAARDAADAHKTSAQVAAAAAGAAAGLPSLTGNGGKVLKANAGETGVEWGGMSVADIGAAAASHTHAAADLPVASTSAAGVVQLSTSTSSTSTTTAATSSAVKSVADQIPSSPIATFYNGTTQNLTNYPVGSVILADRAAVTGLNRNTVVNAAYGGSGYEFLVTGGTALSGTWRARGLVGYSILLQRVA